MSRKRILILGVGVLFFSLMAGPVFSEIILEPNFSGTLLITFPNGEITFIGPGEPIPEIPANSLVEVLEGQVTIHAGEGDTVNVSCLGEGGAAQGGSSVALTCGSDSGLLKVLQGSFNLVDREGNETNLSEGAEYPIQLGEPSEAPPTAGLETRGGPPVGGDLAAEPPVDSRDVESSPA